MRLLTLAIVALLAMPLAGCFGLGEDDFDFEPGTNFTETGKTVHLRMWVKDLVAHEVYPGFEANLWAFCAEPFDPNDAYSAAAIEPYKALESDGDLAGDEENCGVPAPTLRVTQGDRVIVEFENDHFHCHTIHWHGQYVPFESDGVQGVTQDSVCQGESFTYDFIASRAGTLWYHCHVDVQFHVMQGLYGVMIVEPQDTTYEPEDIDEEYVLVYSTLKRDLVEATPARKANPHIDHQHSPDSCGASGVPNCQNPPVDVTPDTWLLNGRALPNTMGAFGDPIELDNGVIRNTGSIVEIEPGERVRLRMLNAGETFETIHTHGHDMYVTHRDGNPLPPGARFWVDTLTIGPAERYDVVIEGRDTTGVWVFHTHVEDHVSNDGQAPGGGFSFIVYPGYEDQLRTFKAELPGGLPYVEPIVIPEDHIGKRVFTVGSPQDLPDTWDGIPVSLPCAVRTIFFSVTVSSPVQAANDLALAITDPNGEVVHEMDLGSGSGDNWQWSYAVDEASLHLLNGTYQVSLTGNGFQSTVEYEVLVDYFDSNAQLVAAGACDASHDH